MYKLLRSPGRTFPLDELLDHVQAGRRGVIDKQTTALPVSRINLNPVSDPQELEFLAGLVPFHRIPSKVLFKVVRVATGLEVRDRWVAIRTIMLKRIPIPVAKPLPEVRHG